MCAKKKESDSTETGNTSLMSQCVVVAATAEIPSLWLFLDSFIEFPQFRTWQFKCNY